MQQRSSPHQPGSFQPDSSLYPLVHINQQTRSALSRTATNNFCTTLTVCSCIISWASSSFYGCLSKITISSRCKGTTSDLAKYLDRSQLVSGGLRFDDQPGNYLEWRSTFTSIDEGLDLSAHEQIDLLIKWLGPESGQHARRVKAVNTGHPSFSIKLIWTRLEECYGLAEAIERSLFSKVEHFPRISKRDNQKLCELSDRLFELEVAKEDRYLPGLMCLDTA